MSEYQYYEFQALDKPLTKQQQKELRSLSSRAEITATSFVNEYNYGDFRGEPQKLMERYFDAFCYLANWGTRRLMFRLPKTVLDALNGESRQAAEWLDTPLAERGEVLRDLLGLGDAIPIRRRPDRSSFPRIDSTP